MTREQSSATVTRIRIATLLMTVILATACQSDGTSSSKQASTPSQPRQSAAEARKIDTIPWDSEEVVVLASRLTRQIRALRQSVRREPSLQDISGMQSKRGARLLDTLRVIELSARQLSTRVAGGAGLDDTFPIVQKIGAQLRDARVDARQLMLTEPTLDVIEEGRATLQALSPFYGIQLDPVEPSGTPPVEPAE